MNVPICQWNTANGDQSTVNKIRNIGNRNLNTYIIERSATFTFLYLWILQPSFLPVFP